MSLIRPPGFWRGIFIPKRAPTAVPANEWRSYRAWRDVGGVKMYFKGALRENGAKTLELIVSEWKINSGLTAKQLSRKP